VIISLRIMELSFHITEMERIYCAVRTEPFIQVDFDLKGVIVGFGCAEQLCINFGFCGLKIKG
jgi:hypothetical protein